MPNKIAGVAALQCGQQSLESFDDPVAQRGMRDERRLDAEDRAVRERQGDADVLDVEQVSLPPCTGQPLFPTLACA
jgi:hypothetical protein